MRITNFITIIVTAGSLALAGCTTTPPPATDYQDARTSLREIFPKGGVVSWNPNMCDADLLIQRGQVVAPQECGYLQRWSRLTLPAKITYCQNIFQTDRYSLSPMDSAARQYLAWRYGVRSWRDCVPLLRAQEPRASYRYRYQPL